VEPLPYIEIARPLIITLIALASATTLAYIIAAIRLGVRPPKDSDDG